MNLLKAQEAPRPIATALKLRPNYMSQLLKLRLLRISTVKILNF